MELPLALFLVFMSLGQLLAQPIDLTVKRGKEFAAPRRSSLEDVVGHDATGIYVLKTKSRGSQLLEKYDNDFLPIRSRKMEIVEDGEYAQIHNVLFLKNRLYIFYLKQLALNSSSVC